MSKPITIRRGSKSRNFIADIPAEGEPGTRLRLTVTPTGRLLIQRRGPQGGLTDAVHLNVGQTLDVITTLGRLVAAREEDVA